MNERMCEWMSCLLAQLLLLLLLFILLLTERIQVSEPARPNDDDESIKMAAKTPLKIIAKQNSI